QAEDGIRDDLVTGVQTCALPILTMTHTVVTGPPGTGKSQVVTNMLVNAAWRGMKVLFASKNNKAVDVVEARVNGLGNRPVLLRRSEERRVGKGWRSRGTPYHEKR